MSSQPKSAPLGEVVATVFDQAEFCCANPAEVVRLASLAVMRLWMRSSKSRADQSCAEAANQVLR